MFLFELRGQALRVTCKVRTALGGDGLLREHEVPIQRCTSLQRGPLYRNQEITPCAASKVHKGASGTGFSEFMWRQPLGACGCYNRLWRNRESKPCGVCSLRVFLWWEGVSENMWHRSDDARRFKECLLRKRGPKPRIARRVNRALGGEGFSQKLWR